MRRVSIAAAFFAAQPSQHLDEPFGALDAR
jgi:ABC-type nitrate/sulfonate/bicarbonate transport system ATPase subunit